MEKLIIKWRFSIMGYVALFMTLFFHQGTKEHLSFAVLSVVLFIISIIKNRQDFVKFFKKPQ